MAARAMATAKRVVGHKKGEGCKAMAIGTTTRAMVAARTMVGNNEGNGKSGKGNGNTNEGSGQQRRWSVDGNNKGGRQW